MGQLGRLLRACRILSAEKQRVARTCIHTAVAEMEAEFARIDKDAMYARFLARSPRTREIAMFNQWAAEVGHAPYGSLPGDPV